MALTARRWALSDGERKVRTLWDAVGPAIAFSILQLRRHLFVDLAERCVAGATAGWLALRIKALRRRAWLKALG